MLSNQAACKIVTHHLFKFQGRHYDVYGAGKIFGSKEIVQFVSSLVNIEEIDSGNSCKGERNLHNIHNTTYEEDYSHGMGPKVLLVPYILMVMLILKQISSVFMHAK